MLFLKNKSRKPKLSTSHSRVAERISERYMKSAGTVKTGTLVGKHLILNVSELTSTPAMLGDSLVVTNAILSKMLQNLKEHAISRNKTSQDIYLNFETVDIMISLSDKMSGINAAAELLKKHKLKTKKVNFILALGSAPSRTEQEYLNKFQNGLLIRFSDILKNGAVETAFCLTS